MVDDVGGHEQGLVLVGGAFVTIVEEAVAGLDHSEAVRLERVAYVGGIRQPLLGRDEQDLVERVGCGRTGVSVALVEGGHPAVVGEGCHRAQPYRSPGLICR